MRRLVWPGVAWLLVAVGPSLAAQRAGDPPAPRLEEPRPFPAFPVALVPFSIPATWCQGGVEPRVTLRAYNSLSQPVHVLRMRGRTGARLMELPMRCGDHVAFWDGTIDDPPRLPPGAVYYINLTVERPGARPLLATKKVVTTQ